MHATGSIPLRLGAWLRLLGCGSLWLLGACAADAHKQPGADVERDAGSAPALDLPWPAETLAPLLEPADNPTSEPKRALGRLLFYDPIMSSDRATACVTCHSEIWGLGDQLPRSVGIDGKGPVGPGRVGPHMTRRNAQSLWNVAYRERIFWDGRAGSLEEQALMPLENGDELNRAPLDVIAELSNNAQYVALFEAAFPDEERPVTVDNLARVLACFVRAYVSDRAPYDQYLRGDALALDDADKRGMQLFAELDCHSCHTPPRFESERYADRHVPNPEGLADEGRFEYSKLPKDRRAFRVQTLRNARDGGPFFHNGSVALFEDAVRHEVDEQVKLGVRAAPSADELSDLIKFLRRALADTSREQHPPRSVPSGLPIPLDDDRLLRGSDDP